MIKYYNELENPSNQILHLLNKNKELLDFVLPNSWYITTHGRLYNCMNFSGHSGVSLTNTFHNIENGDFDDSFTKCSFKNYVKYDFPYVPLISEIKSSNIVSTDGSF